MKIQAIQPVKTNITFGEQPKQKREFIDVITDKIKNPRDVEDCVKVPRGIFKAYILLMSGSSLMMISSALPKKLKVVKSVLNIGSAALTAASAFFFAKPFAIKGLSPTVKKD